MGLDLSQDFVKNVKNYNVNCTDTEIDPNFPDSKNVKEWNTKGNVYVIYLTQQNILSIQFIA